MQEKTWLDNVARAALVYNDSRSHRDFQSAEILNFVEFLHHQYGYVYIKPAATQQLVNTP